MWTFLARQFRIFALGFIVASAITLFILVDTTDVLITLAAGAGGGLVLAVALNWLERRFPEQPPPSNPGG